MMWKLLKGVLAFSGFIGLGGTVAYNVSPEVRAAIEPAIQEHYCAEVRAQDSTQIAQLAEMVELLQEKNDSIVRVNRDVTNKAAIVGQQLDVTTDALDGVRRTLKNSMSNDDWSIARLTGSANRDSVLQASRQLLELQNNLAKSSYGIRVGN